VDIHSPGFIYRFVIDKKRIAIKGLRFSEQFRNPLTASYYCTKLSPQLILLRNKLEEKRNSGGISE
jgi:hypothetical protein